METRLFNELLESVQEMDDVIEDKRKPSRAFEVNAPSVRAIRGATGLSQAKFAKLVAVNVGTLRNWEQGRRTPTGPARALLHAIDKDPEHVLRALSER